jgi:hypothetical protein
LLWRLGALLIRREKSREPTETGDAGGAKPMRVIAIVENRGALDLLRF